ncbi:MAG: indole-3-glycerol phosphate synthase TrpC [Eubacteriales bacterium]
MVNENGQTVDKNRDILAEIAQDTRRRIAKEQQFLTMEMAKSAAESMKKGDFPFEKALRAPEMSFICEVKKASPSKGLIAPNFPYVDIALDYETAGASAISCLTEPHYFQGSNWYLEEIADAVNIPVLKKDFTVDEYMIYQAKIYKADAILLICAILSDEELKKFFALAEKLGLSAIFEAHDNVEIQRALACGARIIGVNNRNLKTFELDLKNSLKYRKLVPNDVVFISESGIRTRQDIETLESYGVDAVLIGETLMRAPDKSKILGELRGL